ncbi:MAG: regulatory protein RecX [Lachnospiraceae bacterium]|nr:regulatory protein RecX [Lachnospiraceae bacterium]
MRVTQLQKITARRYKVCLEDGTSFPLYAGEIRKYQISQDREIPEEILHEITQEVLIKRSRIRCLNLLKSMDRTEGQLRERLSRDGYPDEITDQAIAYAASFHYVDDGRYAQTYVRQQAGRKSRRQIEADLMKRGIEAEEIRRAFCVLQEEDGEEDPDTSAIRALIRKRGIDPARAQREELQKFIQYLMRKGFRYQAVREVIGSCAEGHFED